MKIRFFTLLAAGLTMLVAGGCATAPEYYEELTDAEQKKLLNSARVLALQGKAMPEHLRGIFPELTPYQRIVYDGNKRGKATFRWEIYENPVNAGKSNRITQKDINPYWIMVYATGDLTDPKWQLTHAHETTGEPTMEEQSRPQQQRNMQRRSRPVQKVRYKR